MFEQLPLRYDARWTNSAAWDEVLNECRRIVALVGLKEAAYDLDTTPSQLSKALNERNDEDKAERKYMRGEWLLYFVSRAPDLRLLTLISKVGGCEPTRIAALTPEQENARLRAQIEKMPPAFQAAFYAEAGVKP